MNEYDRKVLLERVEREAATVGASIPETIDLDGEPFQLHEFVFETRRRDSVPAERRETVADVKKRLRRARRARKQRLEDEPELTRAEGERLVDEIVGIDRALHALQNLGPTDLQGESDQQERAEQERWLRFLKQALGRENAGTGGRR